MNNIQEFLNIGLIHYLLISFLIFALSLLGIIITKNTLKVFIFLELIMSSIALNFIAFANFIDNEVKGMIFALFIMAISAAQLAIGISFILAVYQYKRSIDIEKFTQLKG